MKYFGYLSLILCLFAFQLMGQTDRSYQMSINFENTDYECNSDIFRIEKIKKESILLVTQNTYNEEIDEFTGKKIDDARGGKILLFPEVLHDYSMTVDMKFLGCNLKDFPSGGWFGFTIRAQDFDNYEIVWFMPGGGGESNSVAYVPVAHGVCPWWTEAYNTQEKGNTELPHNDWFTAQIDVKGDEFSVYVNNQFVFKKKLSYYLTKGKAGLFVGTATDVAFKNIRIESTQ